MARLTGEGAPMSRQRPSEIREKNKDVGPMFLSAIHSIQ